jgi:hypothetical protein
MWADKDIEKDAPKKNTEVGFSSQTVFQHHVKNEDPPLRLFPIIHFSC